MNRYIGIFHLVTAADGAEEYYTLENNNARTEDLSTACEVRCAITGLQSRLSALHVSSVDGYND